MNPQGEQVSGLNEVSYSTNWFLDGIVQTTLRTIEKLDQKLVLYQTEELKQRNTSRFFIKIDRDNVKSIQKSYEYLKTFNVDVQETTLRDQIVESHRNFDRETEDFNSILDNVKLNPEGTLIHEKVFEPFELFLNNHVILISVIMDRLYERFLFSEIKHDHENLRNAQTSVSDFITDKKAQVEDLITRLEQKVYDQDIIDIKTFYTDRIEEKKRELRINQGFYYGIASIFLAVLIFLILDVTKFHVIFSDDMIGNLKLSLLSYALVITVSGLLTFLISDFRKRFNISKSILDEIEQKKVIVDSYAVFMEKKKTITESNQVRYEIELIRTIFQNLLSARNNGYVGKDMQGLSPNVVIDLLSKLGKK